MTNSQLCILSGLSLFSFTHNCTYIAKFVRFCHLKTLRLFITMQFYMYMSDEKGRYLTVVIIFLPWISNPVLSDQKHPKFALVTILQ